MPWTTIMAPGLPLYQIVIPPKVSQEPPHLTLP